MCVCERAALGFHPIFQPLALSLLISIVLFSLYRCPHIKVHLACSALCLAALKQQRNMCQFGQIKSNCSFHWESRLTHLFIESNHAYQHKQAGKNSHRGLHSFLDTWKYNTDFAILTICTCDWHHANQRHHANQLLKLQQFMYIHMLMCANYTFQHICCIH